MTPPDTSKAGPKPPRILISGDSAITVEFGSSIEAAINARVIALDRALNAAGLDGFVESVPTYRSLMVHYDPVRIDIGAISSAVLAIAEQTGEDESKVRQWRVPVVYGGAHGIDLDEVADRAGLTPQQVIERHAAATYRVYMIGFTPGYSYLGGLDPSIVTPRRKDPRLTTPAGTVAIGGEQTGIQCLAGPSGWNLIGRTPVKTFHPTREPMFLLEPGDLVSFVPIEAGEWDALERAAEAGAPVAERIAR